MRDVLTSCTADPQIAHKLSQYLPSRIVDKLCLTILLLPCNDPFAMVGWLYVRGFLPTMKLQLSQLP